MVRMMSNRVKSFVRLSLWTALLSFVTACSIPTYTKASIDELSATDDSFSSMKTELVDIGQTSASQTSLISDEVLEQAEEYMSVLVSGDLEATCDKYSLLRREMISSTYDFDEDIYRLLHTRISYFYGCVVRHSQQEYDLDVTCRIPDLMGCVEIVRKDEAFMSDVAEPWIVALVDKDQENLNDLYQLMNESVLKEAMRRIEDGEYEEVVLYTSSFRFHQNVENWNCTRFPQFVGFMAQNEYMSNLCKMTSSEAFDLVNVYGPKLVENGQIEQSNLDETLESIRALIVETT